MIPSRFYENIHSPQTHRDPYPKRTATTELTHSFTILTMMALYAPRTSYAVAVQSEEYIYLQFETKAK